MKSSMKYYHDDIKCYSFFENFFFQKFLFQYLALKNSLFHFDLNICLKGHTGRQTNRHTERELREILEGESVPPLYTTITSTKVPGRPE